MNPKPNQPENLSWPALLGVWTEFAQASVALPKTAEGERWKKAVPAIIALQAVTFALKDLGRLRSREERALALDKADMLIRKHVREIHELWRGERFDESGDGGRELVSLIDDARRALDAARGGGLEWVCAEESLALPHPADLIDAIRGAGFEGDLLLASPGVPIFESAPIAFARARFGGPPEEEHAALLHAWLSAHGDVAEPEERPTARQVYRQFDFGAGGPVRDLVSPLDADLPPGQPLLVPVIQQGQPQPVPLPPRKGEPMRVLPVEFAGDHEQRAE